MREALVNSEWQSSTCRQIIQMLISDQIIFFVFHQGVFYFQLRHCFRGYQNSFAQAAPFQEGTWVTSSLSTMVGLWQPPQSLLGTRARRPCSFLSPGTEGHDHAVCLWCQFPSGQRSNFRTRVVRQAPEAPFSIHYGDLKIYKTKQRGKAVVSSRSSAKWYSVRWGLAPVLLWVILHGEDCVVWMLWVGSGTFCGVSVSHQIWIQELTCSIYLPHRIMHRKLLAGRNTVQC